MIGHIIRKMLGPLEVPVVRLYRGFFFNCPSLARDIRSRCSAESILEIGCGEGQLTECLAREFPDASITGIDITPKVGRLFQGDRQRVVFLQQTIQEFVVVHRPRFDLVVICDVLHHVDWQMQGDLLNSAKNTLKPEGNFVIKDWEKAKTLICLLAYISDRYITGDRIRFRTADEFRDLINGTLGIDSIQCEQRYSPWRNNLAFFCHVKEEHVQEETIHL